MMTSDKAIRKCHKALVPERLLKAISPKCEESHVSGSLIPGHRVKLHLQFRTVFQGLCSIAPNGQRSHQRFKPLHLCPLSSTIGT
jgi:hypothetical protein